MHLCILMCVSLLHSTRSAGVMSSKAPGIRETVKVLLTLLTDSGCPHVPSESFRQAKFNKAEAMEPFWMILQHVVSVHQFLKSGDLRDMREVVTSARHCSRSSTLERKKAVLQVKTYALEIGYVRLEFYEDTTSSREQLLFFAWLLQAVSLTSQLQSYHTNAALDCLSIPLAPSKYFLLEHIEKDVVSFDREVRTLCDGAATLPLDDVLRKTEWVKGTLLGNCRAVENAHKASAKLSHTVLHSCSESVSQRHQRHPTSLHDLFLLRYPEQLSVCVKRLEWHVASLNNLLKWQEHEPVFWQWMESVLDQLPALPHTTDCSHREELDASHDTDKLGNTKVCIDTLSKEVALCQQKLSDAIAVQKPHLQRSHKARSISIESTVAHKNQECKQVHHLSQQKVAIDRSMWCWASGACSDSSANSIQQGTVEQEISRLQTNMEKMKEELDTLRSTLATYVV